MAAEVMIDSSGNGRHGSYVGTAPSGSGLVVADPNRARAFTGSGCGQVPDAAWMDAASFTVLATIKPAVVTGTQTIAARYDAFISTTFSFSSFTLRLEGNKLSCHIFVGNTPGNALGATSLSAGSTYDVAATYDGATGAVKVLLAGVSDGTATRSGMNNAAQPFSIGAAGPVSEAFNGTIDDVAYFGSVLSPSALATLAGKRAGGASSADYRDAILALSPLAYYRLGEHSGALAAVAPSPLALLSGTRSGGTISGTLAATAPRATLSLVGTRSNTVTGALVATAPSPSATASGTYGGPTETDTSNALGGLSLGGYSTFDFEPAPATPPVGMTLAQRYEKALAYPTPTITDGRLT